jgi:hypothetical protein
VTGLTRAGVVAVRRAIDVVSGLVTEDTDPDTAAGYHRLCHQLDDAANGMEDRIWLDQRTPHAS